MGSCPLFTASEKYEIGIIYSIIGFIIIYLARKVKKVKPGFNLRFFSFNLGRMVSLDGGSRTWTSGSGGNSSEQ